MGSSFEAEGWSVGGVFEPPNHSFILSEVYRHLFSQRVPTSQATLGGSSAGLRFQRRRRNGGIVSPKVSF